MLGAACRELVACIGHIDTSLVKSDCFGRVLKRIVRETKRLYHGSEMLRTGKISGVREDTADTCMCFCVRAVTFFYSFSSSADTFSPKPIVLSSSSLSPDCHCVGMPFCRSSALRTTTTLDLILRITSTARLGRVCGTFGKKRKGGRRNSDPKCQVAKHLRSTAHRLRLS